MSIKTFFKRFLFTSFFAMFCFISVFMYFHLKKRECDINEIIKFSSSELRYVLSKYILSKREVVENFLSRAPHAPLTVSRGIYYIVDVNSGKLLFVGNDKYKDFVGIEVNNIGQGVIGYSIFLDAPVVRITKRISPTELLVYEERFDYTNFAKLFVERFVDTLPLKLSVLITDTNDSIVYFKKRWTLFVGAKLGLISFVDNGTFSDFPVINIEGNEYIFKKTELDDFGWVLYVLYPVRSYYASIMEEMGALGIPLVSFLLILLAVFYHTSRSILSDIGFVVSRLKAHKLDELEKFTPSFSEIKEIGGGLLEVHRELYRYKRYLDIMLNSARVSILMVNDRKEVVLATKSCYRLFECSDLEWVVTKNPWVSRKIDEVLKSKRELQGIREKVPISSDGSKVKVVNYRIYPYEIAGEKGCVLEMVDVTDEVRLQEQLMVKQRIESLGILAGGLAHDFNNIMNVISGYAQIIKESESISKDGELREYLEVIERQAQKASKLIKQLLDFARMSDSEKTLVDLKGLISDFMDFMMRILPYNIELRFTDSGEDKYYVLADISKIRRMLVNLILNARDAMPDGGMLSIHLGKKFVKGRKMVVVEVRDTGKGMSPEVVKRIFDPFFTTKGAHGTGLGLSQVYGIVQEHGGFIEVESREGEGTTFRIYLPEAEIE